MLRSPNLQAMPADRTPPLRNKGYIPTLDGWRAIAIIWVIFNHAQVWSFGRFSTSILHETGSHGVELFFALSGFLICTRLLREEETFGSISLPSFYTRRLFRIQPAALVYLSTVALLGDLGLLTWYGLGLAGALFDGPKHLASIQQRRLLADRPLLEPLR